jgi:hypothetical protein
VFANACSLLWCLVFGWLLSVNDAKELKNRWAVQLIETGIDSILGMGGVDVCEKGSGRSGHITQSWKWTFMNGK